MKSFIRYISIIIMPDCPICYERIAAAVNCVVTECGHLFHTSCLLTHTSYNGYGCPCCRKQLANPVTSVEDNDEEMRFLPDDSDQYVLDGARWLFQRANNEETDDNTDPYIDQFERWQTQMVINQEAREKEIERKTNLVLKELEKIKAISYEDLVKGYLFWNQEHLYANSLIYEFNNRKVTSTLTSVLQKIT
jgi:hypothetical protein